MKLSLAGWSLHPLFRGGQLTLLDYPAFTRDQFGIDAVELNSPFFASRESAYLIQLVEATARAGSRLLNIAVDESGDLSSADNAARGEALKLYGRWIPVARALGCSAIRCNSGGKNAPDRRQALDMCIQSFTELARQGCEQGVTILIENHGGLSSDPDSIIAVMEAVGQSVGKEWIGTLPDFGNWYGEVDRYEATAKILPYARAIHAKTKDIDEHLNHPAFDLARCVEVTRKGGYDGYLGIEYEGAGECVEGVRRSVRILKPLL